jgi:hypothetical protein
MVPRRIGFHLKYVDSTFYTVFREILGFFLVFVSNWPSLYIMETKRYTSGTSSSSYHWQSAAPARVMNICKFKDSILNRVLDHVLSKHLER